MRYEEEQGLVCSRALVRRRGSAWACAAVVLHRTSVRAHVLKCQAHVSSAPPVCSIHVTVACVRLLYGIHVTVGMCAAESS